MQFAHIGLNAQTSGLHIRQIVLKNVIYLEVRNIHTYPFVKPRAILNIAIQNIFSHNPPKVQSGSCFTNRLSKIILNIKNTKKYLPTISQMAPVESAIMYYLGLTK